MGWLKLADVCEMLREDRLKPGIVTSSTAMPEPRNVPVSELQNHSVLKTQARRAERSAAQRRKPWVIGCGHDRALKGRHQTPRSV
jgi:hypothetical protein